MTQHTPLSTTQPVTLPGSPIDQPGPWAGISPYRPLEDRTVDLPVALGDRGAIMFWIHLNAPIVNGPGVQTDGHTILELLGLGKVNIWWYHGYGGIVFETGEGMANRPLEVPGLPGPQWLHLCYSWDASTGMMDGYLNGTPMQIAGSRGKPFAAPQTATQLHLPAKCPWPIAGLRVSDQPLTHDDALAAVPSIYRGAMDHTIGAQNLGTLDPDAYRGELAFHNPLSSPDDIAGWRMEGPGAVEFHDGWMRMWSTTPDAPGKDGHIVHWCDQDCPADFLLEFDVRVLGDFGLNIIFFCATGRDGRDALDPGLAERTGVFGHYTMGDLNCYHVSYFASFSGAGRATSNLRKNHGFYLVDNGPIGILGGDHDIHHVALLKRGGTIRLAVDNRCVMDWHDDGQQYGPILGEGKIALRQMKPTTAEYQNLRVSHVRSS